MIAARMAYGNLFLHRTKSLILGSIMCLGIAVLFVGNSLIDTAVNGLRKMFVEGYTGDVMVTGPTSYATTIFGDTAGGEDVIPHIAQYTKYQEYLAADTRVKATMPMLSGKVAMGLGEQVIGNGSAFGVDSENYKNFFSDNVTLLSGTWPEKGDASWIIISETSAAMLSRTAGKTLVAGDKIVLSALNDTAGTVIREVTIKGIIRFNQSNQELALISLVDADTLRDLLGFASLRDGVVKLTTEQEQFVSAFNPDNLFGEESAVAPAQGAATASTTVATPAATDAATGAGTAGSAVTAVTPQPAWQFLLIKLQPNANASQFQKDLASFAAGIDENDHVQDWVAGAGSVARGAMTMRLIFNLMISIVGVIVILITMNVLVVSISERVPEIGTLRALGARRSFVRTMILLETTFLAIISGIVGLLVGYVILLILKSSGITAPNVFFEAIFAGKKLVPSISVSAALQAFISIFVMSLISSLYPISLALKIKPVVAMQGE
ncbi:MAG: FtsX-like permease family protein [Spirochaetaceae bacterium]|nr:FtsX-like permease family protein [Spirochaetaceae bacterium]